MSFDWSDKAIEQLKDLNTQGMSCSQIARAMGGGLTRCAVIGKLARLGVAKQPSVRSASVPRVPVLREPRPKVEKPAPLIGPEPIGEPNDSSPSGTCQWIHGDVAVAGWRMCGHPGTPWCPFHQAKSRARA